MPSACALLELAASLDLDDRADRARARPESRSCRRPSRRASPWPRRDPRFGRSRSRSDSPSPGQSRSSPTRRARRRPSAAARARAAIRRARDRRLTPCFRRDLVSVRWRPAKWRAVARTRSAPDVRAPRSRAVRPCWSMSGAMVQVVLPARPAADSVGAGARRRDVASRGRRSRLAAPARSVATTASVSCDGTIGRRCSGATCGRMSAVAAGVGTVFWRGREIAPRARGGDARHSQCTKGQSVRKHDGVSLELSLPLSQAACPRRHHMTFVTCCK